LIDELVLGQQGQPLIIYHLLHRHKLVSRSLLGYRQFGHFAAIATQWT